jgi:hypothetical protein
MKKKKSLLSFLKKSVIFFPRRITRKVYFFVSFSPFLMAALYFLNKNLFLKKILRKLLADDAALIFQEEKYLFTKPNETPQEKLVLNDFKKYLFLKISKNKVRFNRNL